MTDHALVETDVLKDSRLPQLIALADEASSPRRRQLLRALTDHFFGQAPLPPSENGLYGMTFAMAVFAVIVVQKNVRDLLAYKAQHPELYGPDAADARRQTAQREF